MPKIVDFEDEKIKKIVYDLWSIVTKNANRVIYQADRYGFAQIEVKANPNIHQMLATLRGIEKLIDGIIDDSEFIGEMGHDSVRHILNAKDALNRMQRVAISLNDKNKDDFDESVAALKNTAPF